MIAKLAMSFNLRRMVFAQDRAAGLDRREYALRQTACPYGCHEVSDCLVPDNGVRGGVGFVIGDDLPTIAPLLVSPS